MSDEHAQQARAEGVEIRVQTQWSAMVLWIVVFSALAIYLIGFQGTANANVQQTEVARLGTTALGACFAFWALGLVRLGLSRPRLTLGPLGLIDHSTGRGLMYWSDFMDAKRHRMMDLIGIQTPWISLFAAAEVCRAYNQRLSLWRRFSPTRFFGVGSIKVRTVALDHELGWLVAELNRRIAASRPAP